MSARRYTSTMTDSANAARGGNNNHPNAIVCATPPVFWSSGSWLRAQTDSLEELNNKQEQVLIGLRRIETRPPGFRKRPMNNELIKGLMHKRPTAAFNLAKVVFGKVKQIQISDSIQLDTYRFSSKSRFDALDFHTIWQ